MSNIKNLFQTKLEEMMKTLQLDDEPAGGCVVVYHEGQMIAKAALGKANPTTNWNENTLALNFSTGKGVLVTLTHILVSEGIIDYDEPIAKIWPEFGNNGKQGITLRHVLTHRAGLFNIRAITDEAVDMFDWSKMLSRVEQMQPETTHSSHAESAYSALVFGWVIGGLIEKATSLDLNEALKKYLAAPLGMEESMYYGVPTNKLPKVATLTKNFDSFDELTSSSWDSESSSYTKSKPVLRSDSTNTLKAYSSLTSYECWRKLSDSSAKEAHDLQADSQKQLKTLEIAKLYLDMKKINFKDFKNSLVPNGKKALSYADYKSFTSKIPAANNVATADALATMYAMLANKGVWKGKTLINPEVFEDLSKIHVTGLDAVMPATEPSSMQWRLGYHRLFSRCADNADLKQAFGHMGYNGSVAWCDVSKKLAVAFVHNYDVTMSTDIRQFALTEFILEYFSD